MRELEGSLTGMLMKDEEGFVYFAKSSSFKRPVYVYSNIMLDEYIKSIVTISGDISYDFEGNPESINHYHSPKKYNLPKVVVNHKAYS